MDAVNRAAGIGASEVPRITGDSPWGGQVGVWMDKVGLGSADHDTPGMAAGRGLERAILRLLGDQLDTRLTHNRQTFRHPDWPDVPLFATPDGFGPHRLASAEIKVVGHHLDDWRGGPPGYVRLQAQAQLACLPRTWRVWVGALIGGEVRSYLIERDPEAIEFIEHGVVEWWRRYVIPEIAPDPESPEEVWALLRARVTIEDRPARIAGDAEEVLGRELVALLDSQDDLSATVEGIRRDLAGRAAHDDLSGHGWRAKWSERRSTDWAAMAREEGIPRALIESYTSTTKVFTFRRTKAEEEPV